MVDIPHVPLSQVLRQDTNYITELEPRLYSKLSVKLYGRGVTLDAPTDGSTVKMTRHQLAKPGQVILSEIWAKKGALGIVPPDGRGALVTSHFFLFDIDETQLLPRFIYWLLHGNYFADELDAQAHGTTGYAAIRPKQFLALEIPLPPLAEQQRLVARIEELARRVEEARGLRREAVEEAGLLLGRAIVSVFESAESKGWTELTLGDVTADIRYGTSEKANDDPSGIPVFRMGNIQDGRLSLRDLKYLDLPKDEFERLKLGHGDILVNRTNSAELVGKCAVFDEPGNYVYASYIIRVRLDLQRAEPRLVAAFINSPIGRQYMFEQRKQMTGQANVNSQKLKALPFRLPPLEEQRRIVAHLDGLQAKVDELKRLQSETQKELDALMPSILARAFAGEL